MTSPLPSALLPLTIPLAWLYQIAIERRNRRFDKGNRVKKIDRPVISVGNITLGGTGKTPMVMWIVDSLLKQGHKPVIAMRGYGAKSSNESDEALEYEDRFGKDVPVIIQADRYSALQSFLNKTENEKYDCVVLDDGFQHRRLHRDLDVVLIDATQNTFKDRMCPSGMLREPLTNLKRADVVILTRCNNPSEELAAQTNRFHGKVPIAYATHEWITLKLYGKSEETKSVDWLQGKKVSTLFGTGNPSSIEDAVTSSGATILTRIPASDHQTYTPAYLSKMFSSLPSQTDALVTTHKDWVKIRSFINAIELYIPVVVPVLSLNVKSNSNEFQSMLIKAVTRQ